MGQFIIRNGDSNLSHKKLKKREIFEQIKLQLQVSCYRKRLKKSSQTGATKFLFRNPIWKKME